VRPRVGPLVEVLADVGPARVVRVHGALRDPVDGKHGRLLVAFAAPAIGARSHVAQLLRTLADEIEDASR
jgi:hypothetical protein